MGSQGAFSAISAFGPLDQPLREHPSQGEAEGVREGVGQHSTTAVVAAFSFRYHHRILCLLPSQRANDPGVQASTCLLSPRARGHRPELLGTSSLRRMPMSSVVAFPPYFFFAMEVAVSAPVLGQERAGAAQVEHMDGAGDGEWWQNASSDARRLMNCVSSNLVALPNPLSASPHQSPHAPSPLDPPPQSSSRTAALCAG
jgi:hypothetical protein